ncbi:methyltransferase domain-containing protein [Embleya sp. NPDC050154]|uniref:methyltransferase domain-containing protein n=1 Tax=Embleya sp. NPDC050154 TaxID=3363988 RepID=UPI0037B8B9C9
MSKERNEERATPALVALLDAAEELSGARQLRRRAYELLDAGPGSRVLDVGCGAGRAVDELARRGVEVVGVDPDGRMIEVARSRWPERDFRRADARRLPLPDACVDGYLADKVYHELHAPEQALVEARRVLTPGGRIVLVGQDWDAFVIDSDDPALTRTIVWARADSIAGPRSARRYRNLLRDAGFGDVTVEARMEIFTDAAMLPMVAGLAEKARATGAVTRVRADAWIAEQRERAEADRMFLALPMFVAAGTAPRRADSDLTLADPDAERR